MEIGILINNVGVTYEYPNYFDQVTEDRLWQLINVNMTSAVMVGVALYLYFDWADIYLFQMTKMILPDMVDR